MVVLSNVLAGRMSFQASLTNGEIRNGGATETVTAEPTSNGSKNLHNTRLIYPSDGNISGPVDASMSDRGIADARSRPRVNISISIIEAVQLVKDVLLTLPINYGHFSAENLISLSFK